MLLISKALARARQRCKQNVNKCLVGVVVGEQEIQCEKGGAVARPPNADEETENLKEGITKNKVKHQDINLWLIS